MVGIQAKLKLVKSYRNFSQYNVEKLIQTLDVCQRVLEFSPSGQSALTDHVKGKKHIDSLEKMNSFLKNAEVKKIAI